MYWGPNPSSRCSLTFTNWQEQAFTVKKIISIDLDENQEDYRESLCTTTSLAVLAVAGQEAEREDGEIEFGGGADQEGAVRLHVLVPRELDRSDVVLRQHIFIFLHSCIVCCLGDNNPSAENRVRLQQLVHIFHSESSCLFAKTWRNFGNET